MGRHRKPNPRYGWREDFILFLWSIARIRKVS